MKHISTVVEVAARDGARGRTWWRIKTADGNGYSTHDALTASLCQRAQETGAALEIDSFGGFYYRRIDGVKLVAA